MRSELEMRVERGPVLRSPVAVDEVVLDAQHRRAGGVLPPAALDLPDGEDGRRLHAELGCERADEPADPVVRACDGPRGSRCGDRDLLRRSQCGG